MAAPRKGDTAETRVDYGDATYDDGRELLFEVTRREVVGEVYSEPGGDHPVRVGFRIAADAMAEADLARKGETLEFYWEGIHFEASANRVHNR
jgi:hypothetical protein